METTCEGMVMLVSAVQLRKAPAPRLVTPVPRLTVARLFQPLQKLSGMDVQSFGKVMVFMGQPT